MEPVRARAPALAPACALLLAGCGLIVGDMVKKKGRRPPLRTDGAFDSSVREFETAGREHGKGEGFSVGDVPVVFGGTEGDRVGECVTWGDGRRSVTIKREFWDKSGDSTRESLLFHELGHCRLNRGGHESGTVGDPPRKRSLMHGTIVQGRVYEKFKRCYRQELFGGEPVPEDAWGKGCRTAAADETAAATAAGPGPPLP